MHLPLSGDKITIDRLDCNFFKVLLSSLDRLSLGGLEFWSVRLTLAWIVSASSFSRSFTASSILAMVSLLGSVLEVIEKLRPFARRPISKWVNYLKDILIIHSFLSAILVALCHNLFLLIIYFLICLFFVNSKDFLYEFSWIFSTLHDGTPQV